MNIERLADGRYRLRWYVAGRGSPRRQKTFPAGARKKQVETFAANLELRKAMGELVLYEQRNRPLRELSTEWWAKYVVPNLAHWTRVGYRRMLVNHIEPRLGSMRVGEISPEIVADFRAKLEGAGVGRHSVRQSMVVLRVPEELLALEVKYVRRNTILIEQRNIDGQIVGGQKVRGFHPRAIDLLEPVRRDLRDYLLATGIREGVLFPRRDGQPWVLHDYQN